MDQTGAVMGPLAVAAMIYFQGEYRNGFTILIVPAVLGLIMLTVLQFIYPNPSDFEDKIETNQAEKLPGIFWIYLGAVAIIAAGYADFPLIAFHFQKQGIASGQTIPLFYALAMGVDAVAALIFGYMFDRIGISILIIAALLSSLFAPLVFLGDTYLALLGMAFWGVGMGAQESVLKAAIAGMVPKNKRATAYGIFSTGYGLSWFLGSAFMGILYDRSITSLVIFSGATQLLAIPCFVWVKLRDNNLSTPLKDQVS